jgi:hypothetical protein
MWLGVRLHVLRQDRHEDAAGGQRSRRSAYQTVVRAHLIPAGHGTVITTLITKCRGREKRFPGDSLKKDVARPRSPVGRAEIVPA